MPRPVRRFSALVSLLPVLLSTPAANEFNTNFLYGDSAKADLSRFDRDDTLPDGEYTVGNQCERRMEGRFPLRLQQSGHDSDPAG